MPSELSKIYNKCINVCSVTWNNLCELLDRRICQLEMDEAEANMVKIFALVVVNKSPISVRMLQSPSTPTVGGR